MIPGYKKKSDTPKLLIFRIGHLGDTLVSLPALWAIRKAYPNAHLALLSNSDKQNPQYISATAVLPENGLIDEWITYPTNLGKTETVLSLLKLIQNLFAVHFCNYFSSHFATAFATFCPSIAAEIMPPA